METIQEVIDAIQMALSSDDQVCISEDVGQLFIHARDTPDHLFVITVNRADRSLCNHG